MKKNIYVAVLMLLVLGFSGSVLAQDWQPVAPVDESSKLVKYESYAKIPDLNISIPTVVQVSVRAEEIRTGLEVFDNTDKKFVQSNTDSISKAGPRVVSIPANRGENLLNLIDNNSSTFANFYLASEPVYITLNYSEILKSNALKISLGENVALPDFVTIRAYVDGQYITVVNNIRPNSTTINFPITSAKNWIVEMSHSQLLRISELTLNNTVNIIAKTEIRFLAQPEHSYTLYANSETIAGSGYARTNLVALKNASSIKDVGTISLISNQVYIPEDSDSDGVPNYSDNCVNIANQDQTDVNNNRIGDACDDFDQDGLINSIENCINIPNPDQRDTDGDGVGDLCDTDESRLTEKYPFIVWFGIGFAGIVFLGLLFVAGNKIRKNNEIPPSPPLPPQIG